MKAILHGGNGVSVEYRNVYIVMAHETKEIDVCDEHGEIKGTYTYKEVDRIEVILHE